MLARKHVSAVVIALLENVEARMVTKIVNEKLTIKATRRHKPRKRDRVTEVVLTVGAPNYAERKIIRKTKGHSVFPPDHLRIKWYK